MKSVNMHMN